MVITTTFCRGSVLTLWVLSVLSLRGGNFPGIRFFTSTLMAAMFELLSLLVSLYIAVQPFSIRSADVVVRSIA